MIFESKDLIMENSQILLAANAIGAVAFNTLQNKLNIGLGTVLLSFSPEDTALFHKTLLDAKNNLCKCPKGCSKVFIQTPLKNLQISLTEEELEYSLTLLEWSLLRMEIEELLS